MGRGPLPCLCPNPRRTSSEGLVRTPMEEREVSFALDIALGWYVAKGLAIFPCKEKKPLVETGFKAASKDSAQIKDWWTLWPRAIRSAYRGRQ